MAETTRTAERSVEQPTGSEVSQTGDTSKANGIGAQLKACVTALASLRLTVYMLSLAIFLVFSGTLVQVDKGIWTVVDHHFRCWFTWVELKIFFPRMWNVPGGFPFPGGWLIGGTLLANILAAHLIRFKLRARGKRLALGTVVLALGIALTWMVIIGYFTQDLAATKDDAFWRVLFRLGKGSMAALVLVAGCILLFYRRAGIVLLHSGIILILVGELVTGLYAVEGNMRIEEGGSANYAVDNRSVELALTNPANGNKDQVIAVPEDLLGRPGRISNPDLPFDIQVLRFFKNSRALDSRKEGSGEENPANAGIGLSRVAVEQPPVSGTDVEQKVDVPSVYLTFIDKNDGKELGTYLFSLWYGHIEQPVVSGEKRFEATLRFRRMYKPYTIHLKDFRHDKYVGTDKPKNFSSEIRLVDPSRGVDREAKIWMNNPLRYAGETFYQSGFEGENVTILQVVKNAGWMIPYVSCMIVGMGMLFHFSLKLFDFLKKRSLA